MHLTTTEWNCLTYSSVKKILSICIIKLSFINFISHTSLWFTHDFLGSCKIKFVRKNLTVLIYQTQCLLTSALFASSSYAYSAENAIETGNIAIANNNNVITQAIIKPLEKVADNSSITHSISTNAQGTSTKTYKIKPANIPSKVQVNNQTSTSNISTMNWEKELKYTEPPKLGAKKSNSKPKLK